jgi:hypothetical protein
MRITIVILHAGQLGIIGFYGMRAQDDIVQPHGLAPAANRNKNFEFAYRPPVGFDILGKV